VSVGGLFLLLLWQRGCEVSVVTVEVVADLSVHVQVQGCTLLQQGVAGGSMAIAQAHIDW
jgi:hypothetical protein